MVMYVRAHSLTRASKSTTTAFFANSFGSPILLYFIAFSLFDFFHHSSPNFYLHMFARNSLFGIRVCVNEIFFLIFPLFLC